MSIATPALYYPAKRGEPVQVVVLTERRLPLIAPNEVDRVRTEIEVRWHNLPERFVAVPLHVKAWDRAGRRHTTHYDLLLVRDEGAPVYDADELVPGVYLRRRYTTTRPALLLRAQGWLAKLPGCKRLAEGVVP